MDKPLADPWAGSGCNCSSFCDNSCAINATVPKNITVYRMTPFGVTTLAEKNSADVAGDVSFVISRRAMAYECKVNPSSYGCNTMVQFQGDDPNSTDLVLEMQVEIDGQWGACVRAWVVLLPRCSVPVLFLVFLFVCGLTSSLDLSLRSSVLRVVTRLVVAAQALTCTATMSTRAILWEPGSAQLAWTTPPRSLTTPNNAKTQTTRRTSGLASKESPR